LTKNFSAKRKMVKRGEKTLLSGRQSRVGGKKGDGEYGKERVGKIRREKGGMFRHCYFRKEEKGGLKFWKRKRKGGGWGAGRSVDGEEKKRRRGRGLEGGNKSGENCGGDQGRKIQRGKKGFGGRTSVNGMVKEGGDGGDGLGRKKKRLIFGEPLCLGPPQALKGKGEDIWRREKKQLSGPGKSAE